MKSNYALNLDFQTRQQLIAKDATIELLFTAVKYHVGLGIDFHQQAEQRKLHVSQILNFAKSCGKTFDEQKDSQELPTQSNNTKELPETNLYSYDIDDLNSAENLQLIQESENGNVDALLASGQMYLDYSIKNANQKCYEKALPYLEKAAKQDKVEALLLLSGMFREGLGCGVNKPNNPSLTLIF